MSLRFLMEFLRSPGQVGAIAPSSRRLAEAMCAGVDWTRVRWAIECGPGQGVFTRAVCERLHAVDEGGRCLAVELSPRFHDRLAADFAGDPVAGPLDLVNDNVADLDRLRADRGIDAADVVLSGLPWASFPEALQDQLLGAIADSLAPGGHFATFAYLQGMPLPAGRRFRRKLEETFETVETSRVVWRNVPPAVVYRCRTAAAVEAVAPRDTASEQFADTPLAEELVSV